MQGFIASCTLAALLLAVASADHHKHHNDHNAHNAHNNHNDLNDRQPTEGCKLANPNADFGFALYKSLNAKAAAGKNIFFSPLGISSALSMLTKGAREETYAQLISALGYSNLTQPEIDEAYGHAFSMFQRGGNNREVFLGNAMAVREGFSPLKMYQTEVEQHYSAKLFELNFSEPATAAAEINRYIANNTRDMIKDQVKDLDPDTAMVLINYIYFMGEWEKPFNANLTRKEDFHVDENTKVQVDMMKRTGRYDYYQDMDSHASVILLPYKGNTSMMIVLPDEGKMGELEAVICKEHLRRWHNSLFKMSVDLLMPKFSINADASLVSTLQEMGVTNAFEDSADFTGISTGPRLKVSKVSHRAALNVDEMGTTAAASTTIEIMPMSMPESMKLNRPFMVFILDHATRSILFMGKINNPTAM